MPRGLSLPFSSFNFEIFQSKRAPNLKSSCVKFIVSASLAGASSAHKVCPELLPLSLTIKAAQTHTQTHPLTMPSYEHKQQAPADLSVLCVYGCSASWFCLRHCSGGRRGRRKGLKNCQAQVKKLQQSTLTFMRA